MNLEELRKIDVQVGERTGWDFSVMKTETDPVPWQYLEVVRRYLKSSDYVLDVGTGGGERFIELADTYGKGVGVDRDAAMISTANSLVPSALKDKIKFMVMDAEHLSFPNNAFDIVIDRQGPTPTGEISRVLKPNGYFITQIVGGRNMDNINREFNPDFVADNEQVTAAALAKEFEKLDCNTIAVCSYDVGYYVKDVASLLFWLKALRSRGHASSAVPGDFEVEKYYSQVNNLISKYSTDRGIETNEHRELLIARKSSH